MATKDDLDPQPLLDGGDGSRDHVALRHLLGRLPEPSADQLEVEAVWQAVQRPGSTTARGHWVVAFGSLAFACAALATLALRLAAPRPPVAPDVHAQLELVAGEVSITNPVASAQRGSGDPATMGAPLGTGAELRTGADGRAIVDVERARVLVSPNARMELAALGPATALRLANGALLADVAPRRTGEAFQVQAGRYLVTVKGTLFRVKVGSDEVSVSCTRGQVEVSAGTEHWDVQAGQAWRSLHPAPLLADDTPLEDRRLLEGTTEPGESDDTTHADPGRTEAPPQLAVAERQAEKPLERQPVHADDPYASALELDRRGRHQEAAALLRQIVSRRQPNAELALYHLAQLEQGPLADAPGAERDFLRYEKEYPQGALAQEAELSAIDLALQRSAFSEALSQMDGFLRDHPTSERRSKVHLLRGNVLRSQGNAQAAIAEYGQVGGAEEDDALYFSGLCQGALGHAEGAAAAFRSYLSRFPRGRHVADARRGLGF